MRFHTALLHCFGSKQKKNSYVFDFVVINDDVTTQLQENIFKQSQLTFCSQKILLHVQKEINSSFTSHTLISLTCPKIERIFNVCPQQRPMPANRNCYFGIRLYKKFPCTMRRSTLQLHSTLFSRSLTPAPQDG